MGMRRGDEGKGDEEDTRKKTDTKERENTQKKENTQMKEKTHTHAHINEIKILYVVELSF